MKHKRDATTGVQELCRKLKLQLEELAVEVAPDPKPEEERAQRTKLMERLKAQLAELG